MIKFYIFLFCLTAVLIVNNCLISARVDWSNLENKPSNPLDYNFPHDANFTRAEIARSKKTSAHPTNPREFNKIKNRDELIQSSADICINKISLCMSNCNTENDINSTVFALKAAFIRVSRARCYDECYSNLGRGCEYPIHRIQY